MRILMLAAAGIFAFAGVAAHADQIERFDVTATSAAFEFHPAGSLNASLWVDLTNGTVSYMNVTFTDFTGTYKSSALSPLTFTGGVVEVNEPGLPYLQLALPVSSLIGYSGGAICTATLPCGVAKDQASFVTVPNSEGYLASRTLSSGMVTASGVIGTTPEPASLVLLATAGLGGLTMAGVRKLKRN